MEFRTQISFKPSEWKISHDDRIVMLGSCFTDNIGTLLQRDGFNVVHNPMGPLYNPDSIGTAVSRALIGPVYATRDLVECEGVYHCLDFASRYQSTDSEQLLHQLNGEIAQLGQQIEDATVLILSLGTAYVYRYIDTWTIVGNCHKIPACRFKRSRLSVSECISTLSTLLSSLPFDGRRIIFTVSPIRHVGDGLHENQLSKSALLLAIDDVIEQGKHHSHYLNGHENAEYFPAYEIMMDDLRDYRFYAADMKHPSDTAIQYIYEQFASHYFTPATLATAQGHRRAFLRSQHRPILP